MSAIERLPYLDNVVRESLRFCPAVHSTIRVATKDEHIPLSHPITLKNGQTIGTDLNGFFEIKKGSYIHIPIEGFSLNEDIWGPDALEFKYVTFFRTLGLQLTSLQDLKGGKMFKNGVLQNQVSTI